MKRTFTKLMAALALLLFIAPPMVGWGQTRTDEIVTWSAASEDCLNPGSNSNSGTFSTDDFLWNYTRTPDGSNSLFTNFIGGNTQVVQLGKNGSSETITLSTSNIPGTIKSVSILCASYNQEHSVSISVGGTTYLSSTKTAKWQNNTVGTSTGTGSSSGLIEIAFTKSNSARALYIKSISVTYEESSGPATYTVTYDCNGGTSNCPDPLVVNNVPAGDYTLASAPSRTDYAFGGWNDGTTTFGAGATYPISQNVTFTAQWTPTFDYISVAPTSFEVPVVGDVIQMTMTTNIDSPSYEVVYYTTAACTNPTDKPAWFGDVEFSDGNMLDIEVNENDGVARTAYFKVKSGEVESEVVTVSQAAITVATPEFDVAAGTYYEDQLVDISCATSGATIRYTTDGTTPTANSTEYDGNGVGITENTTLKAIAIKNSVSSEVATATYTIIHPLSTMDAIFEAATNNGSTASNVNVTFGNWVVSGVSGSNVFVTDNSGKGFIIYKSNHGFAVNDKLSGTVLGTPLKLYNGSAEFTNLTTGSTGLSVSHDGTIMIITDKAIADLSGVNTGAVITLNNLTYDGTNLSDGTNTIKPHTTLHSGSFTSGKTYNVTGVYQQYNTNTSDTKEILPRSAADIEEVVAPTITLLPNSSIYVPVSAYQMEFTYSSTDANRIDQVVYDHFDDALNAESFAIQFYDGDGNEDVTPDWFVSTPVVVLDENENKLYLSIAVRMNTVAAPRTAYFKVWAYNGSTKVYSELVTVNQAGYVPAIAVNPAEVAVPNGGGEGQLAVTYDPFTFSGNPSYNVWWCDADGNSVSHDDVYPWLTASFGETRNVLVWQVTTANESEEARTAYLKVEAYDDFIGMVYSNLVTITQAAPQISVTVTPTTVNFAATDPAGFQMENLTIAYENIEVTNYQSFTVQFYDNQGNETEASTYQWLVVSVTGSNDEGYVVRCVAGDNAGAARTASFKVYAYDADNNKVYSDPVTINQAKYDCANLPFSYDGNGQGNLPTGLTVHGTGTYNSSPRIQFNDKDSGGVEDYVILKINEEPGVLKFDIKGNSFSGGTFRMQTSTDGITYTDKVLYTEMPTTAQTQTISDLASDVRYIKWSYAKVSGNVAFGKIQLAKAPQKYDLTVNELTEHISAINVFNADDQTNPLIAEGAPGTIKVYEGTSIMVSPDVPEGYVLESLMINNENVISQLDETGAYTFTMPDGNVTISATAVALPPALYSYSVNGVEDQPYDAFQGQTITLAYGQELNQDFTFAGWTTDPSNVSERLSGGTEYELTEEVTVFYAVYAKTVMGVAEHEVILDGEASGLTSDAGAQTLSENGFTYYASSAKYQNLGSDAENNISTGRTILIGKEGANLHNTTTFGDGITKFEIYANKGAAQAATAGVYFSTSEITEYTTGDNTWESNSSGMGSDKLYDASSAIPSGAKYFWYQVTNDKNTQVQFRITYTATESITTYYTRVFLNETATADITIAGPSIVPSGSTLNMGTYTLSNTSSENAGNLVIEDGAQVKLAPNNGNVDVYARVLKNITGYGEGNGNWYLLSAPSHDVLNANPLYPQECPIANLMPADQTVNDVTVHMFDLYKFDQTKEEEWQNFRNLATVSKSFIYQEGRLYARKESTTLEFGVKLATSTNEDRMYYYEGKEFAGWSLIGNAMMCNQYVALFTGYYDYETTDYYRMNAAGTALELCENGAPVAPMEGIFVQTTNSTEEVFVEFSSTPIGTKSSAIDLNVSFNNAITDRARVRFGEGSMLGKFNFNENATKLYIPQGNEDYAVVRSANEGEMPVSFKASKNGTYTLSINTENVDMNYLHLIDNMTGADIDLLATPSYSFEAKTSDYASRFRLVFSASSISEDADGDNAFAYYNGSSWTVSNVGEATLQVVDMMGRVLSSETLNGNANVTLNQAAGIYMLRLVNGENVMVQKVVVR